MRFVMFTHTRRAAVDEWSALPDAERNSDIDRHRQWFARHAQHIVGGEELAIPERARIVRREEGRISIVDGPLADEPTYIGGVLTLDAPDAATAEAMAAEWPGLGRWQSAVELRPIDPTAG